MHCSQFASVLGFSVSVSIAATATAATSAPRKIVVALAPLNIYCLRKVNRSGLGEFKGIRSLLVYFIWKSAQQEPVEIKETVMQQQLQRNIVVHKIYKVLRIRLQYLK